MSIKPFCVTKELIDDDIYGMKDFMPDLPYEGFTDINNGRTTLFKQGDCFPKTLVIQQGDNRIELSKPEIEMCLQLCERWKIE